MCGRSWPVCVVQRRPFAADDHLSAATAAREIDMATAKKKAAKKAASKKRTRKPQDRSKASKVSKGKTKATMPHGAAGKPTSGFQNPYRVGGSYWASVDALASLGIGQMHAFAEIVPAVKKSMGDNWKIFAEKESRSAERGKDAAFRILQNVSVLARKDYGKPLRELHHEVRWDARQKAAGLFRLDHK